jgi:ElaB/YqjD/DUF883 family membrane-anchored ribosome-binding protein
MKHKKQAAKTNPRPPQECNMHDLNPVKEASQDFAADFAALRDDITKLTSSVTELVRTQSLTTTSTVLDAVDGAQQKFSNGAAEAQNRIRGAVSDFEAAIERNPLVAVLTALSAGLLIGMVGGMRK